MAPAACRTAMEQAHEKAI